MTPVGQPLLIRVPGREPEIVRLTGEGPFPLGRSPENKVVVNDSAVSRHGSPSHAVPPSFRRIASRSAIGSCSPRS